MRGKTKIFELSCLCTYKDKVIREKLIFLNFPTTPAFDLSPYFGVDAIAILLNTNSVYSSFFIASIAYSPSTMLRSKLSPFVQIVQIVQSFLNCPKVSKLSNVSKSELSKVVQILPYCPKLPTSLAQMDFSFQSCLV